MICSKKEEYHCRKFKITLSFLPLYWIVACYSMIFLLHILIVFTQKYSKVYELGLLLFALCDCCTAISFLTGNIMTPIE